MLVIYSSISFKLKKFLSLRLEKTCQEEVREIKEMRIKRGQKEEKGAILIIAVIILMLLLLLSFPFLFQMSTEYKIAEKTYKSFAALNLAEAGIDRAIWELNHGDITTWPGDSSSRSMTLTDFQASGGKVIGDVEIIVTEPESDNPVVESIGKVAYSDTLEVSKATRVVLNRSEFAPFTYAAFGDEGIIINVDTDTNSYDSRAGPYGDQTPGEDGNIGTNSVADGGITLDNDADIKGKAYSGPESDPDLVIKLIDAESNVIDKLSLSRSKKMLSIPAPQNLDPQGFYTLTGAVEDTINQSGEYSGFVLSDSAKTTITGDITLYINGEFLMNSNSTLEISPTSTVTIYLGGESFEISGGAKLNNVSLDPTKLLILGTDGCNGTMYWGSDSEFYGAIYVPKAIVDYRAAYEDIYGSLIAKKLISNAHFDIHFDIALFAFKIIGDPYAVKSWQEKFTPQN